MVRVGHVLDVRVRPTRTGSGVPLRRLRVDGTECHVPRHRVPRAGFEFTGVREVVLETRRDVDTAFYGDYSLPPRITDEEHELTITASQRRGLVYSPDAL